VYLQAGHVDRAIYRRDPHTHSLETHQASTELVRGWRIIWRAFEKRFITCSADAVQRVSEMLVIVSGLARLMSSQRISIEI